MKTTATQEQLTALAEAAFLPLEFDASLEEDGRYQVRILDGSQAIHIEEMPASEVRGEQDLHAWFGRMRGRLEEKWGIQLAPLQRVATALR